MNFHQTAHASGLEPDGRSRYSAVRGAGQPHRNSAVQRLTARASAPILGSRLLFPRRFDRAFGMLRDATGAPNVPPEHVLRYYGARLHLDIRPSRLRQRISDWVRDERGLRWTGLSFLDAAVWDNAITPVQVSPVHREMQEIIAAGDDFRDMQIYRSFVRSIERGRCKTRNNVRLDSVEAVDGYFRYCLDLVESAREHGIVRHSESGAFHRLRLKHREARSPLWDSAERDIGVAIAENGDLIRHLGGKHRTAIAQALDLPVVPVEIRMVHTSWLERHVARTGLPPHLALAEGVRLIVEGSGGNPASPAKSDRDGGEPGHPAERR